MLAVTSDKSTLHIFDIHHPTKGLDKNVKGSNQRLTSMGNRGASALTEDVSSQKWGILSKIPLMPRVFSDIYSFTSAPIELGEDAGTGRKSMEVYDNMRRPQKGVIGWTSDHSLVVVSAGREACWEKFIIAEGKDNKRYCVRDGWKRFLGSS